MKETKTVILDFDENYKAYSPGNNFIVLSSTYENAWTLDVRKFRSNIKEDVIEYEDEWEKLILNSKIELRDVLKAFRASFFRAVISPFSRWIEAIEYCLAEYSIDHFVFSSYAANPYVFKYEAEGETNLHFLYKKRYYLPYYLKEYLKQKEINVLVKRKCNRYKILFFHFLRNSIMFMFILGKQMLYKIFTFKRRYGHVNLKSKINISSRAIVQTDFIQNFFDVYDDNVNLIVNEQSLRPFRHLKYLKSKGTRFIYAEGNLTFRNFADVVFGVIKKMKRVYEQSDMPLNYRGIKIASRYFLPDLIVQELDYLTYSLSMVNSINNNDIDLDDSTTLLFEMFTPHSFYINKAVRARTLQIQTALIEPIHSPDFIFSDAFYFTSPVSYNEFISFNSKLKHKIRCVPYLKYIGSTRKQIKNELNTIVYYTQPIDLDEEKEIILFLADYCKDKKIDFFLKPHPRQSNIKSIFKDVKVIDTAKSNEEIIKSADVIITRSSSIGLDSWIFGTPCVFIKLNKFLQSQNFFFAPSDYTGTVITLVDLQDLLNNYKEFYKAFKEHALYDTTNPDNIIIKDFINEG